MVPMKPMMWIRVRTDAEYYRARDQQYQLEGLVPVIIQDERYMKDVPPKGDDDDERTSP